MEEKIYLIPQHPLLNQDSKLLAGRSNLVHLICNLIENSPASQPTVCTYSLFNKEFFYEFSRASRLFEKKAQLKHLFCVDTANQKENGTYYNLQVFTHMIPYILENFANSSYKYYYGNIATYDPEGIFFPYFILLDSAVILTSANFETSMYLTSPDIVAYYTKYFNQMYQDSLAFTQNVMPSTNFLTHIVDTFQVCDICHCIEHQPCLLILTDMEIIKRLMNKEIPHRDILLQYIKIRQENMKQQKSMFYFTRAGLDLFAREGIYTEIVPYINEPIPVQDRITILKASL